MTNSPRIAAQKATCKPSMMDRTLASRRTSYLSIVVARASVVSAATLCWATRPIRLPRACATSAFWLTALALSTT
ncbi:MULTISPECIES: hypothetical protein [unclassified Bradyrhizobium]|uniref:hypothetical protein n=1 Tax=unclassified Bradyrhizobium TaxID=2631580 RepID=UPI001144FEDF|nr:MULTISPECIES: hypothetical protein [unclassified Bradyrhizobium]MCP1853114.1 hypothetical protein [Bradyrhizobium sp. USDA 4541]